MKFALVAVALLACPVVGAGCSSLFGPAPLPVRKVLVDVEPAAVGVDREQVRSVIDDVVKKARGIKLVDPSQIDAAVMHVRIEGYGPAAGDGNTDVKTPQKTTLALSLELTSIPNEPGGTEYRGHALASGVSVGGVVDARSLVGSAVRDALAQVLMSRGAGDLKSDVLISWLNDEQSSVDQKKRAIRILGSRREKAAVDAIGKILTANSDNVEEKDLPPLALSALENIGDPSAVDAVIAYSDRQPAIVKKECIAAVKSMGSPRAKAWLFTLSTGAPDLDVQEQAQVALATLEAKEIQVPKVAASQKPATSTATP